MEPLVNEPFTGPFTDYRSDRPRRTEYVNGLNIHISVSYKTLLIVFALFTVASRMLNLIIDYIE